MCIEFRPCLKPDLPGIYWRDDDQWRRYNRATTRAILKAASMGPSSVYVGTFTSSVYPDGAEYTLDLQSLQQQNTESGQERPILVIPKLRLTQLSMAASTPAGYFSKKMWKRITDAFTTEAYVEHVVTKRASKCNSVVLDVRRNPYLTPGSPLITQFVAAAQNLPVDAALADGLTYMDSKRKRKLDLAFHGTRSSSLEPILRNGMCPYRRESSPLGDWFTREVASAAHYSRSRESRGYGGRKVIAFFLLVVKEAVVRESDDVIVLNDARYELPVAEVTVE